MLTEVPPAALHQAFVQMMVLPHQLLAFRQTYVPLADLVRSFGTRSSALTKLLPGVELVGARPLPDGIGRGGLVRIADLCRLAVIGARAGQDLLTPAQQRMIVVAHRSNVTRLSQKTDAYFFASGGEAEPSPPWHARDAPSLSHCHPASVWSRLARQTFRLAPLSSPARRASHGIPPVLDVPHALAVSTSPA